MKVNMISLAELECRLDDKFPVRLVDVRSAEEYQAGRLEGAVSIPFTELERRLSELQEPGPPVIFYCSRGGNSLLAARMAAARGIPACSLANGIHYYNGSHMAFGPPQDGYHRN